MAFSLSVIEGPDAGSDFNLPDEGRRTAGRGSQADFRLADAQTSRTHCAFEAAADGCFVRDLGSRNGTFLNGRKVDVPEYIHPGDRLLIGESLLIVVDPEERPKSQGIPLEAKSEDYYCLSCGHPTPGRCRRCGGQYLCPPDGLPNLTIQKRLGRGGMGAVFLVLQGRLERPVAMKVAALSGQPEENVLKRFFREARVMAKIKHPNIVQIFDMGRAESAPPPDLLYPGESPAPVTFLLMEYVKGDTLDMKVAEEGPLEFVDAVRIARDVASGLAYASEEGIVHRDIKPSNVMLGEGDAVKVMDFGLAKCFENSGLSGITCSGTILGTPAFMSPEQIRDSVHADHRSDIYALGASLYFLLTGKPPFPGRDLAKTLRRVLDHQPAPVEDYRPDVPKPLRKIVKKCMEKDPARRYKDASVLEKQLQAVLDHL